MAFKNIVGYENYGIFDNGDVVSKKRLTTKGGVLSAAINSAGYKTVVLCEGGLPKTKRVHRLVAEAFIPNPNDLPQVNHKDGNKLNNHYSNLEWCTASQNIKHAHDTGLIANVNYARGKRNGSFRGRKKSNT